MSLLACEMCKSSTAGNCGMHGDWPPKELRPYKCPVCDGTAKVSRPPWIAGDQKEWTSNGAVYECGACENGVIWK